MSGGGARGIHAGSPGHRGFCHALGNALTETDPNQYVTTCQYDAATGNTALVNHRTYDSFGDLKSQTNAAVEHLFAYTGRFLDEITGDQNHLHRWYDPDIAQWLSEDPTVRFDL